jgi:beta-glucosidase
MQVIEDVRSGRTGNVSYIAEFEDRLMLQKEAVGNSRLGIPLLIGRDVLNGYKTTFPVAIAQAATWDMEAIEASERVAAAETTADGYFWTFTPMVDVSRDPRWGRNVEGSGEDAYLASQIAAARVRGFQGDDLSDPETMLACMKHFVGYGDVQAGREYHAVDMSQRKLYEYHLPAFKAAVDAGVRTVMPAFNEIAGTPATANKALLKDLLRDQWGFDGAIVSDFEAVLGLTYHGTVADDADAAAQAFNAGVEIEMTSNLYGEVKTLTMP